MYQESNKLFFSELTKNWSGMDLNKTVPFLTTTLLLDTYLGEIFPLNFIYKVDKNVLANWSDFAQRKIFTLWKILEVKVFVGIIKKLYAFLLVEKWKNHHALDLVSCELLRERFLT